jgi:hypothetical protein
MQGQLALPFGDDSEEIGDWADGGGDWADPNGLPSGGDSVIRWRQVE